MSCGNASGTTASVEPAPAMSAAPGAPAIAVDEAEPAGTNRRPAAVILETPSPPPEPSSHSMAGSTSVSVVVV